jgi:hypothetical protein
MELFFHLVLRATLGRTVEPPLVVTCALAGAERTVGVISARSTQSLNLRGTWLAIVRFGSGGLIPMSKTLMALYRTRPAAGRAVDELLDAGFTRDKVAITLAKTARSDLFEVEQHSRATDGAALGGGLGVLVGAVGALLGFGTAADGVLVTALGGAGIGAIAGGLGGALLGLLFSRYDAQPQDSRARSRGVIVGVRTADSRLARQARRIFERTAIDYRYSGTTVARDVPSPELQAT